MGKGLLALAAIVLAAVAVPRESTATPFTRTVPGTSIILPSAYPEAGGVAIVMVGVNGNVYYQFSDPVGAFVGYQNTGTPAAFRGNPFTINNPITLDCGIRTCSQYFGGSIAQIYIRFSAYDGDTASGNFDFNRISLRMNGFDVGNWSTIPTQTTNTSGTTALGSQTGFGNNTFDTGWFSSTSSALLSNILSTGRTTTQVFDSTPNDNFWDFTRGNSLTNPLLATIAPGYEITKSANRATFTAVGDVVSYTYRVTNIGSVNINNVLVTDNKIANVVCNKATILESTGGGTADFATCTANYTVTQADVDAGAVTNVANATGVPEFGTLGAVTATVTVTGPAAAPAVTLSKTTTLSAFGNAGSTVPYTFTVRNTGNVTLTNLVVTDPRLPSLSCSIASLAPNAQQTCTASYTVTQFDVDTWLLPPRLPLTNTATVTGRTPSGGTVSATGARSLNGPLPAPALTVQKTTTATAFSAVGDVIAFTISITNTGNITFPAAPTVTDPLVTNAGGTVSCPVGTVSPGQTINCTTSYTITQADIDARTITNTATASINVGGQPAQASGSVTLNATVTPALTIAKQLPAGSPASFSAVGDTLTYEYILRNTGNITLNAPAVTDNLVAVTCPAAPIPPGGSATCTSAPYAVTQADLNAGQVTNTASGRATPQGSTTPVTSAAPASLTVSGIQSPAMTMVKTAPNVPSASFAPGFVVTYNYEVTNTGNVTLTQPVTVSDDRIAGGAPFACGTPPIAPGASVTCSADYAVTVADVLAGVVVNSAFATDGTTVTNTAAQAIPQAGTPNLSLVKTADQAGFSSLTDTLTYTFTVTNTGQTVIVSGQPITITDPKITGVTCSQPAVLNPGGSFTCTGSYSAITQAELDAGEVVNTADASFQYTGPGGGTTTVTSPSSTATVPASVTPSFTLAKTGPAQFGGVGSTVTYTFTVTNTGPQTLASVVVTDPLIPGLNCALTNIAPGGTANCQGSYTVTQADVDAGVIDNTADATGLTPAGTTATASDTLSMPINPASATKSMTLAKTAAPASFAAVGDTIGYTFAVTNTGSQTLTGIDITDPLIPAFNCTIASLAPGATDSGCTATYTVTQADVDRGTLANTASASAPGAATITGSATATGPAANPALSLTKTATPASFTGVGQNIAFTLTVANTGNVTLTNVSIDDFFFNPVLICTIGTLAPGASDSSCTGTYTTTQADVDSGSLTNDARADFTDPAGNQRTTSASITVPGPAPAPSVQLTKVDATGTGVFGGVGSPASYNISVTNTGNVTLGSAIVSDPLTGLSCQTGPIAPGQTVNGGVCVGGGSLNTTYVVTQADVDAGTLTNTATVNAQTGNGTPVSDTATLTLTGPTRTPAISMAKTAISGAGFTTPGQTIAYEYVVTNTGNVTLTAPVTIADDKIATVSCPALPPAGLAAGATLTCTATYAVTQADIDAGSVTNNATATVIQTLQGNPTPVTITASDSETVSGVQTPAMVLAKSITAGTPASYNAIGDALSYTFRITNSGNSTITGPVQVADSLLGPAFTCAAGPLAPGASAACQRTYIVTQADLDAGSVTNSATAFTGPQGSPTLQSPPDAVTTTAQQTPAVSVDKSSTETAATDFFAGNTIDYSYVLTNDGNVTLAGPFAVSDNLATVSCPAGPLAPGATLTCTGAYVLTANDIALGRTTNNATAVITFNGQPVPSTTDSFTIPGGNAPALSMTKAETTGVPMTAVGQVLSYSYTVVNTGDSAFASDVVIFDDVIGGPILCHDSQGGTVPFNAQATNVPPFQATCTATYAVTQTDLDRGFVRNTAFAQSVFAPASPSPLFVQSPTDTVTVDATLNPVLAVTKTVTAGPNPASAGDVLTYTIVTTNSGFQTISAVNVTDPLIPALSCTVGGAPAALPATIAPGQVLVCNGNYTVTQADVDAQTLSNTATVSGTSPQGTLVTGAASTPHPLAAAAPAMTVAKTIINPPAPPAFGGIGEPVTFGVTVTNTGNITLTSVSITDSLVPGTCSVGPLAPGASDSSCTFIYTITQADIDAGQVTNTATAIAQPASPGAPVFSAQGSVTGQGPPAAPLFSVVKAADRVAIAAPGEVVTYTYTVANLGNVTITTQPQVADNRIAGGVAFNCGAPPIIPGEFVQCTATYTVTQADIDAGGVTNTATASAPGVPVSAPATLTLPSTPTPGIEATKILTSVGSVAGDTAEFSITVRNTGNVTLTGVAVADTLTRVGGGALTPDSVTFVSADQGSAQGTLNPGETATYTVIYTLVQADVDAGGVINQATATATPPSGPAISDVSDDGIDTDGNTTDDPTEALIAANALLTVAKSVVAIDEIFPTVWTVTFGIDVANTGTNTLTNLQVTDDLAAFAAPAAILAAQYPVATRVTGFATATANTGYNGTSDINLLAAGAVMAPGETGRIEIDVTYSTASGFPSPGTNTVSATAPQLAAPVTGTVAIATGDTDGDGVPDGVEGCTASDDRDGDGICDAQDYDPTGYFYCESDGRILTGGSITVTGPAGSQSGVGSSNNITILRDGSNGTYQFFVTAAGTYTLAPTYPAGTTPSTTRVPTSAPLDVTGLGADPAVLGSTEAGSTGVLADFSAAANTPSYLVFQIDAGDPHVLGNNLAVENCQTTAAISATKVADRSTVRRGESVTFTLTFSNGTAAALTGATIIDTLPAGIVYTPGSAVLNGTPTEPVVAGRTLSWPGVTIGSGGTASVVLTARVTGGPGNLTNQTWLQGAGGNVLSNIASATIRVQAEHVFDCSDVIGKVFDDRNMNGYQDGPWDTPGVRPIIEDDWPVTGKFGGKAGGKLSRPAPERVREGEPGIPDARLVTTRGLIITTDEFGRYHVPCAELPGKTGSNFTLKLDTRSLPTGYRVTTENPRTLRLTAGKMAKMNFGAAIANVVDIDLAATAFEPGSARPKAALRKGIAGLVGQVEDTPSVIRLSYLQRAEDRKTVRARLDAVEALLRDAWAERGRYKLTIERTIKRVQ